MSKRKLRSETTTANAAQETFEELTDEPRAKKAAKKDKKGVIRYLCYSCDTERTPGAFPDYNPSRECDHLINTCKGCLKRWVNVQIESAQYAVGDNQDSDKESGDKIGGKKFGVKCPQCPALMLNVNVQIATTKKMYAMFEKAERKHIAETTPGWRWCLAAGCNAGQVHESKILREAPKSKSRSKKKIVDPETDVENICTCNECGARACATCDRPYHEGETCSAYQSRVKDRTHEEDKSLREIQRVTRKCPNCKKNIQKNGGCPSMHCFACGITFCWNCVTRFDHGYCKCQPRPVPPQQQT